MIPINKVEIVDAESVTTHSLENTVISLYDKEILTDAVGSFKFTLPAAMNQEDQVYANVAVNNTVKIYRAWDNAGLPSTPTFKGIITKISAPTQSVAGYIREYSGLSQGEILLRRIQPYQKWIAEEVDDIVDEVADDLSLGKDFATDTTAVTIEADNITYLQLLKKISDYWFNAGNQIKKDFYVNPSDDLVWKTRPFRSTTGVVEVLDVAVNISDYKVTESIVPVKNSIKTWGKRTVFNPLDAQVYGRKFSASGDDWTYNASGWTFTKGSQSQEVAGPVAAVGADWMKITVDAVTHDLDFSHDMESTIVHTEGLAGYTAIEFWSLYDGNAGINNGTIRLYAPDNANYYQESFTYGAVADVFKFNRFSIGDNETYDSATNPSGIWVATGSPTWSNVQDIWFGAAGTAINQYIGLDGLCFNFGRWRYNTSDSTSITAHSQRDLSVVDDTLSSDAECETRAKTLLYQLKDPPKQAEVTVSGNTNVLVGDRIPLTIPSEGLSSVDFDVIQVENLQTVKGWTTTATMINSANYRKSLVSNQRDALRQVTARLSNIKR